MNPEANPQANTNILSLVGASFRHPRARPLHRVIVLGVMTLLLSAFWIYIARTTPADQLRRSVLLGGGFLAAAWFLLVLALYHAMPFALRLAMTGAGAVLIWTAITYGFGFGESTSALAVGLGAIWIVFALLLVARTWLVVLGPGEVVEYRPTAGIPRFLSSPIDDSGMLELTYRWISPLDHIKPFWRLDERVSINRRYDNITTQEGYQFALEVRLLAEFNPAQIRAQMFELKLTYMESRHAIHEMLRATLESLVELAARDFFIDMPHKEALAAGSVTQFKQALPQLVDTRLAPIGLRVLRDSVTCIPHGSQEARRAADRAAAAPYDTEATLAVQKELLRQALEGSVPAQLVLYAQMAAQGSTGLGYVPRFEGPEHFLQAINQQDAVEARRLFERILGEAEDVAIHGTGNTQRRRTFDLGQLDE